MNHDWKLKIPITDVINGYICLNCGLYKGVSDGAGIFWWINNGDNPNYFYGNEPKCNEVLMKNVME